MPERGGRVASVRNPVVVALRALRAARERAERRLALVEGPRLLETALASGADVREVLHTARAAEDDRVARILAALSARGAHVREASDRALDAVSDAATHQGLVASVRIPVPADTAGPDATGDRPLVAVAGVQDPGNLGAIVRAADAFGAAQVLVVAGGADPWGPKAVRGSAGSVFRVPVRSEAGPPAVLLRALRARGYRVVAASSRGGAGPGPALLAPPLALVFGSEGGGLDAEAFAEATATVTIPLRPGVESLNVATAAAVLLYEARRGQPC